MMTWQLADRLESEVLKIMFESPTAMDDLRFRSQLFEAVTGVPSNIVEGFLRKSAGDFCRFLDYSLASLGETEQRLRSGIKRQYFSAARCDLAFELVRRAHGAILGLKGSQLRYQQEQKGKRRQKPPHDAPG